MGEMQEPLFAPQALVFLFPLQRAVFLVITMGVHFVFPFLFVCLETGYYN